MKTNPTCKDCGQDAGPNHWQCVVGFQQSNKGPVALRSNRQLFLCDGCMRRRKKGHANQGELFT